jgi:hypothetical protein
MRRIARSGNGPQSVRRGPDYVEMDADGGLVVGMGVENYAPTRCRFLTEEQDDA